jgi:hypothetical protein
MRVTAACLGIAAAMLLAAGCSKSGSNAPLWELAIPTADEGFQYRLPTFSVPYAHEEQSCYFVRVPDLANGQDIWVDHVRMATSTGSHHLNVFRVRTIVGLDPAAGEPIMIEPYPATVVYGHDDYQNSPCWQSANWADWPLVANTQSPIGQGPYTDWQLPAGVAMRFTPGEMLMIQPHYVNTSIQSTPIDAEVGINFYRTGEADPVELGTLFATQQSIRICQSNPEPTFTGTCRLPSAVTITAANGHFHSRGRELSMYVWDGMSTDHPPDTDQFYDTRTWNSPPLATNINRQVFDGGGIWWDCSYQWRPPIAGCDAVNARSVSPAARLFRMRRPEDVTPRRIVGHPGAGNEEGSPADGRLSGADAKCQAHPSGRRTNSRQLTWARKGGRP